MEKQEKQVTLEVTTLVNKRVLSPSSWQNAQAADSSKPLLLCAKLHYIISQKTAICFPFAVLNFSSQDNILGTQPKP
jgi:hypothetical protein